MINASKIYEAFGGPLLSLLTVLIVCATQGNNVIVSIETYNGKKEGFSYEIDKDDLNAPHLTTSGDMAVEIKKSFMKTFFHQPAFFIARFVDSIKEYIDAKNTKFSWGVGATAQGKVGNENALIAWDAVKLDDRFKSVREGLTKDIFNNNFNSEANEELVTSESDSDSEVEYTRTKMKGKNDLITEGRYKQFIYYRAHHKVSIYHPCGGSLPFDYMKTSYCVSCGGNNSFVQLNSKYKSNIYKVQEYAPIIRLVKFRLLFKILLCSKMYCCVIRNDALKC